MRKDTKFDKFVSLNTDVAWENGTVDQSRRMDFMVSQASQNIGELGDFLGGRKKLDENPHHTPKECTRYAINGIVGIVKIRREIEQG